MTINVNLNFLKRVHIWIECKENREKEKEKRRVERVGNSEFVSFDLIL